MLLGALVGAGVPLDVIAGAVDALALPIRIEARAVRRAGLAATKVDVVAPADDTVRTWADVRALLADAPLAGPVRERASAVFAVLAAAEARVHGIEPDEVHFHEVGALDAIADVVGTSAGLVHLGLDELVTTPIALGGGRARTAHGVLPVPGPAVLELLRAAGTPAAGGPVPVELCTPTGAAIIVTAATGHGPMPPLRVTAVGAGAGTRDLADRPNIVRLVLGAALEGDDAPASGGPRGGVSRAGAVLGPAPAPVGSRPPSTGRAHGGHSHPAHADHGRGDDGPVPDGPVPDGPALDGPVLDGPALDGPVPAGPASDGSGSDGPVGVVHRHGRLRPEVPGGLRTTDELVIEANVDDLDPRVWPSVLAALLAAGAVDAWLTPILMKKGRPAHTLRALVAFEAAPAVRAAVFAHTSTLGLRETAVRKHALARAVRVVEVGGQAIRVKISPGLAGADPAAGDPAADVPAGVAQPEWEDVASVAALLGWPARRVLDAAQAEARAGRWVSAAAGG
jgi:uncharacterized protein (DUF111 family)